MPTPQEKWALSTSCIENKNSAMCVKHSAVGVKNYVGGYKRTTVSCKILLQSIFGKQFCFLRTGEIIALKGAPCQI